MEPTAPPRYVPTVRAAALTAVLFALPMAVMSVRMAFDTSVPRLAPHYFYFWPLFLGGLLTVVAVLTAFVYTIIGRRASASQLLLLVVAGWLGAVAGCLSVAAFVSIAVSLGLMKR